MFSKQLHPFDLLDSYTYIPLYMLFAIKTLLYSLLIQLISQLLDIKQRNLPAKLVNQWNASSFRLEKCPCSWEQQNYMMKRLHLPLNSTDHTTPKPTPKYNLQSIKLASMPFPTPKEREFSLRVTDRVESYNPLKDRYLQQFFRRDSRVKLLNLVSNDVSLENRTQIQRITTHAKNKAKSAYQNLIPKPYLSKPYLLRHRYEKEAEKSEVQGQSPTQGRMITEPSSSTKRRGVQVSKEQFRSFLLRARERLRAGIEEKT